MVLSVRKDLNSLVLSGLFLAIALVLPFLTGQIPEIGNALCPMHIPVLLCGYICGPWYGMAVGFIAPFLRFMIFGLPPVMPSGLAMAFELMTYGSVSGFLYRIWPHRRPYIYASLIGAMLAGRAVWGIARVILYGLGESAFGWTAFLAGAFTNAVPGIIVQLALIPVLVLSLDGIQNTKNN